MRINFDNISRPKAVAKSMITALSYIDPLMKLSRSQELTASMYGYDSWYELTKSVGREVASLDDTHVSLDEARLRKESQVERVVSRGVRTGKARYLVEVLHPTSIAPWRHDTREQMLEHISVLLEPHGADSFTISCDDAECGKFTFCSNTYHVVFTFRRADLARSIRSLFSDESGCASGAVVPVSGAHPYYKWSAHWCGRSSHSMPRLFAADGFMRPRGKAAMAFIPSQAITDPAHPRRALKKFVAEHGIEVERLT